MRKPTLESRTSRRWGQNFLVNPGAADAIVAAFRPTARDRVVEIGPGRGALTRRLLGRVLSLSAVEVDPDLARRLQEDLQREGAPGSVTIENADILRVDLDALLGGMEVTPEHPGRVIANLPYNIATAVILRLLRHGALLSDLLVMVQREVAGRILSPPGCKAYGSLSVLCQASARVESVLRLGPGSFRPRPRVDSEMIRLIPKRPPEVADVDAEAFSKLLRVAFAHRRKTLLNNLAAAVGHARAEDLVHRSGLPARARPEEIDLRGFLSLLAHWKPRAS